MDKIHPGMLKALDVVRLSWLTYQFNITWESGTVPGDWKMGLVGPEDMLQACMGKSMAECWKRESVRLANLGWRNKNADFVPDVEQWISFLPWLDFLWNLWKFAYPIYICFVDLEKVYDPVPGIACGGCFRSLG